VASASRGRGGGGGECLRAQTIYFRQRNLRAGKFAARAKIFDRCKIEVANRFPVSGRSLSYRYDKLRRQLLNRFNNLLPAGDSPGEAKIYPGMNFLQV
jgi:hypothetical protein